MSDNVKDSSIWFDPTTRSAIEAQDNRLCIGVIREVRNTKNTNELRYMVEVYHKTDTIIVACRMMRQFGGVYNYEDFIMRGYDYNAKSDSQNGTLALAGDVVLVGKIGGNGREGVILGSMTHPARKSFLDSTKGPQYKSEFNGVETSINESGEWILTFKGQPTNLDKLSNIPDQPVAAPTYDTDVGTSFMKWDKTGSFILSDEATDGDKFQKLFIDKKKGTIDLWSGKVNLHIAKSDQSVLWTSKIYKINSSTSITYKTKNFEGAATDHVHIKTPKYVIESDKVRLGEEGASDWLILGSKFRQSQKTMNNTVSTQLSVAQIALAQAQIALSAAGTAMAVPISGAVVAGPQIALAAVAINSAATAIGAAGNAIVSFENDGVSDNFLSAVSKTK